PRRQLPGSQGLVTGNSVWSSVRAAAPKTERAIAAAVSAARISRASIRLSFNECIHMANSAERKGGAEEPEQKPVPPSEFGPGFLMNTDEVRSYLRVSRTQLWRLVKEEGFPFFKVGGEYRYRKSDVDAWLEAQRDLPDKRDSKNKK